MGLHLAQISQLPLLCSLLRSCHIQPNLQTRSCQPFSPISVLCPSSLPLEYPPFPASYFRFRLPVQITFCLQQIVESSFFLFGFTTLEQTTQLSLPIETKMICFYPSSSLKPQSHPEGPGYQCTEAAKPHAHSAYTDNICLPSAGDTHRF